MTAYVGGNFRYGQAEVVAEVDEVAERPRWLELRRAGIGGSDVAAICGQSQWKGALHVWLEKTGALPDEQPDNERMFWGRILEPIVADVLEERTRVMLAKVPVMLRHPEHEWMQANLDRVAQCDPARPFILPDGSHLVGTGVGEIKTAGHFAGVDWADDAVPDAYVLQGMHMLAITGWPWVLFGCLVGGQRLEVRVVQRDDDLIAHMMTLEAEFWQHVEDRTPPPPDGSKATTELLAHLWDVQADLIVTMDPVDVAPLVAAHHAWSALEKHADARRREVDNRLRWMLGEGEEAHDPDGHRLFTWKADKNGKRTLRFPKTTPTRKAISP